MFYLYSLHNEIETDGQKSNIYYYKFSFTYTSLTAFSGIFFLSTIVLIHEIGGRKFTFIGKYLT